GVEALALRQRLAHGGDKTIGVEPLRLAQPATRLLDTELVAEPVIPYPDEENPSLANAASSALDPPGPLRPGRFRSLRLGIRGSENKLEAFGVGLGVFRPEAV